MIPRSKLFVFDRWNAVEMPSSEAVFEVEIEGEPIIPKFIMDPRQENLPNLEDWWAGKMPELDIFVRDNIMTVLVDAVKLIKRVY